MAEVLVGRIGRPHGIRGEVTVEVRTDDPQARFAAGSVLFTDPAAAGPLRVEGSRMSGQIRLVAFAGVSDRDGAEALRGLRLLVDTDDLPQSQDPDEYYDHQLIGLTVRDRSGAVLGEITDVLHPPAAPVLQVGTEAGEVLVPFVAAIVPEVDVAGGFCVVDPPEGMFSPQADPDDAPDAADPG
ncbi:ribosome maturation factor RimM [Nakamurella aerolata]|uniref:Ribosome maturation factor RimM n=1 Tax=Nakamurella aerolata TaxID=1656892 RepID=A0A849A0M2_9ACTN|nr:ribosome maturation factor RimM [Nakamurella aerolata]NNG34594.1 ribosome maturation factor RimM [Nakamurella aerolata]